jgi:ABC-2 type transport system ATP-binding protein
VETVLRLRGVTKRFGDRVAVDGLDLEIPRGCIYGFLGQNGAGKTTTIRMIMSILMPDEGSIEVLGHPDALAVKDRLGYLPEEKGLYKKMRTGELIAYFGRLKGLTAHEAKTRARRLLDRFGLGAWHDKKCEALSKGMGQKVQILATLIHDPELIILDEPFSGLDPVNQDVLRGLMEDLRTQGKTVIFSTHVMAHAEQLCDSVFLIHHGKKLANGPLEEVLAVDEETIQLEFTGDASVVQSLWGVREVREGEGGTEILLEPGTDPQEILRQLVGRVTIRRFDLRRPSLHDFFVRVVGPDITP